MVTTNGIPTFGNGKYEMIELLDAKGGQGDVYLVEDVNTKKEYALKKYSPPNRFTSPIQTQGENVQAAVSSLKTLQRFEQEVNILVTLNHPSIIKIYDFNLNPVEDDIYIVLQYVEGANLSKLLTNNVFTEAQVAQVAIQIADALEYTSHKGIVHRDIKPANILYSKDKKRYFLADFGVSKFGELTSTGEICGTPQYMSPELVSYYLQPETKKPTLTYHTDMYALGATMYHAISRKFPFHGINNNELITMLSNSYQPPKPLFDLDLDTPISEEFSLICETCMAKNVEDRYESFSKLKAALYDTVTWD